MTVRLARLLARLAPIVREEMLKVCVPNCCIATCAVLKRVFKAEGFEARALPVAVIISNRKMVEALARGESIPQADAEIRAWMDRLGAWRLGIVPESELESLARGYPGYGGHLVLTVQNLIIDASIEQANRPEKAIVLPRFFVSEVSPQFLRGEGMMVGNMGDCEVVYRPLRDNKWRKSIDWTDERRYRETVNAILWRVRAPLEAHEDIHSALHSV
jgi:hypothetical protein